jgi:uncharacterized protein (TIGR02271 family)
LSVETQRHTLDDLQRAQGAPVYDDAGDRIGKVDEIFFDDATKRPEWIGVGTGFLGTKRVLVPVEGATLAADGLRVPYSKEHVKGSPDVHGDELPPPVERELREHYALAAARAELTLAEEELAIGTREVEAGRVRLRKWVETEPVAVDVSLRTEIARVVRQPIRRTVAAATIGEASFELQLHAEEPQVRKEVVARERVALAKEVETERRAVTEELRRERVDVEEAGPG